MPCPGRSIGFVREWLCGGTQRALTRGPLCLPTAAMAQQSPETRGTLVGHQAGRYIDKWEEYWITMADTASRKSKDPRCQVGAVIVKDNVVLSTGFNGLARHVYDDPGVLADVEAKLKLICHAEINAIFNAARLGVALKGATIYVTKFPCLACCNAIIQAGVSGIYTHDDRYWDDDPADGDHSRKRSILRQASITVTAPFHPEYAPKRVTGKPDRPTGNPTASTSASPGLKEIPAPEKTVRRGKPRPENMSLFPARQPIRGGRPGTGPAQR
jgi:dCMP deaminase